MPGPAMIAARRLQPVPFFESRPASPDRRLLLVSYHFPPSQAAGAFRWQKFAGVAAERGWGLDVVTLDPACLTIADDRTLQTLPASVRLYGIQDLSHPLGSWEDRVAKALRRLREHWSRSQRKHGEKPSPVVSRRPQSMSRSAILNDRVGGRALARAYFARMEYARGQRWAREAARTASRIIEPGLHRAVISSGPPEAAHEGARRAAERTGLPLVIDLRDPWSLKERLPEGTASPTWYRLADRWESAAVDRALLVIMNTEPARVAMQAKYPRAENRMIAVNTGCDAERPIAASSQTLEDQFSVAYTGSIYLDRDPRPLFRAAAMTIRDLRLEPAQFAIHLMGHVDSFDGVPTRQIAEAEGIGSFVHLSPPGSRAEALELLSRSAVLVSLPQDSEMAIPSKIFDYMLCDAWLLALAREGSAIELLLRDSEADVVGPDDVTGIAAVLKEHYGQFASGNRPQRVGRNPAYSSAVQASRLFTELEKRLGR